MYLLKNVNRSLLKKATVAMLLGMSSLTHAEDTGLPLHGFANVGGGASNDLTPDLQKIRGFKIGTVDFYLNPEFDDKVKTLMELAFEPDHSNGSIGIDVERLQVGYTVSDYFTLWSGRFHTPIGTWNTSFHHGSQLQTSIYRPKFIDFEDSGGIVPAHSVGLWGNGGVKVGGNKLKYNIYVANGSRTLLTVDSSQNISAGKLDMNNYRNDKNNYMVGGSLSLMAQSGAMDGLEVGAHGFTTTVNSYSVDDYSKNSYNASKVNMVGGFINYANNNIEFMAEYYGFMNKNTRSANVNLLNQTQIYSNAEFAQLGYTIPEWVTAYGRFEKTSLSSRDNYFADQVSGKSYTRCAVGLRKDINPKAAFKLEFIRTSRDEAVAGNDKKYNIFQYDYAIRF